MRRSFAIMAFALTLAATASPSGFAQSVVDQTTPAKAVVLGFDGLNNGANFKIYKADGFSVRRVKRGWVVDGTYGNPAPMIDFDVPANSEVGKAVTVTESSREFSLDSIDITSSISAVNWEFVGKLKGQTLYTDKGQVPNPMGGFTTVDNPDAATLVDSVEITLTGLKTACCDNHIGLDNIVVEK